MPRKTAAQQARHQRLREPAERPQPSASSVTTKRAPRMVHLEMIEVDVTPEMAAIWLEGKCANRNISDRLVQRYANDMRNDNWHLNGETIVFDANEALLDGQHRLWAVIESGKTVKMCVVKGADPESMFTFDMGKARTFSNVLEIGGQTRGSQIAATAAKWLWWYDNIRGGSLATPTHAQLKDAIAAHPLVLDAARLVQNSKARRLVPGGILAFIITGALERNPEQAEAFLDALATGQGVPEHTGVYLLRERMITDKASIKRLPPMAVAAYTMKAWNYYLKGRAMSVLRWGVTRERRAESFPTFEE